MAKWQIIHQASDNQTIARTDPVYYPGTDILANTGMSATLIQKRGTNEYTLAIRSTEYRPVTDGGDRDRDVLGADAAEIFANGFALAQLSSLEDYYAWLKSSGTLPANARLTVTGYSLGGHLATVFTEMHAADADVTLDKTFTFNGAGRGTWTRNADDPAEIVAYYQAVLADPDAASNLLGWTEATDEDRFYYAEARDAQAAGQPLDPLSIYGDPRHVWAEAATRLTFDLRGTSPFDLGSADLRNGAAERITQLYGKEFPTEITVVANSGVHGPATGVFVEAQPLVEPWFLKDDGATSFGNGHALVLLADSLALMRAYEALDPGLSLDALNRMFAATSNRYAQSVPAIRTEDDPLETALDALRRLFLGPDSTPTHYKAGAGGFGDFDARNEFHDHLRELTSSAAYAARAGSQPLLDLTPLGSADLVLLAQADIGVRYALAELDPFAAIDAPELYEAHNAQGRLDLYDPALAARAGMTAAYLADRAAMLEFLLAANAINARSLSTDKVTDQVRYIDFTPRVDGSNADVLAVLTGGTPNFDGPNTRVVAFGSEGPDGLQGRDNVDRLYGGDGADFLRGGAADDWLEGGAGFDIYQYDASTTLGLFDSNDGADTIFDADGAGLLRYTYSPSLGGARTAIIGDAAVRISAGEWQSADGRFGYRLLEGEPGASDLAVTILADAGGSLTLKDFADGDFGIRLAQPPSRAFAETTDTITGTDLGESLSGTPAADLIFALDGADTVRAGDGDDSALGAGGADQLYGEAGGDRLYGDAGRDSLYGGAGDDELHGGSEADIVEGGDGADLVAGGEGEDVVAGEAGDDEVYAGEPIALAGALLLGEAETPTGLKGEWIDGGEGADTVIGGAGDDQVMGGGGADVLAGGAGDDNLVGDLQRTLVHVDNWSVLREQIQQGGATEYRLDYNADAQVEESPDGAADTIYGGAGADWIFAGAGDDRAEGGSGADVLFGEAGSDALVGGEGDDVLVGDNPGVVAEADEGADYLDGGAGDDFLLGNGGDDVLFGGPGTDTLVGGPGKDSYVFMKGDGAETISDTPAGADDPEASVLVLGPGVSRDAVKFRTGSLVVDLGEGDAVRVEGFDQFDPASTPVLDAIAFADGTRMSYAAILAQGFDIDGTEEDDDGHDAAHAQLVGTAVGDRIQGFGGNDQLFGLAGSDVLSGGDGADALVADAGDDTLDGGTGADTLWGGAGNDGYVFGAGSGDDLVVDQDTTPDNADWIALKEDLSPTDVVAVRSATYGADLELRIEATGDRLTIADQYGASGEYRVEEIRFADGIVWTPETTPLLLRGTEGDDRLYGTTGADVIEGLGGNDTLNGDTGGDTLEGGPGTDAVVGGTGDDVYLFARGDGYDYLSDDDASAGNVDRVVFAPDIAFTDVRAWRLGDDLHLTLEDTGESVVVLDHFLGDGAGRFSVERIEFPGDGTVWDTETLKQLVLTGTNGADEIAGYASDDFLAGLDGNDTLIGGAGADTLDGGAGNDLLQGGFGDDLYLVGRGDGTDTIADSDSTAGNLDTLRFAPDILPAEVRVARAMNDLVLTVAGGADRITITDYFENDGATPWAVERIAFETDGTVWDLDAVKQLALAATEGDDAIQGFGTNDVLNGLGGNDTLHGWGGEDTLDGGAGNDVLYGEAGGDTYLFARGSGDDVVFNGIADSVPSIDALVFASDIAPAEVGTARSGNDLLLTLAGSGDRVTLRDYFGYQSAMVEEIRFADGTVWTPQTIAALHPISGTSGDDLLVGTALSEAISGLEGADTIYGSGGDDTLDGGLGVDRLYGGDGDDLLLAGSGEPRRKGAASNFLYGGAGNDVLVSSGRRDYLYGEDGNDIYLGGADLDWMEDTGGNNLFFGAGEPGNVYGGDGNDIAMAFAYFYGDIDRDGVPGRDVLLANKSDSGAAQALGAGGTLSLGGGVLYRNLGLQATGNLLQVTYGNKSMGFLDWYGDGVTPPNRAIAYLQIVIDGTRDYDPASSDPMHNRKIQVFDFVGLVQAYDAARAAGRRFDAAAELPNFRLWGSDTEAIGGAIAYQYAMTGSPGALSYDAMRSVLAGPAFAVAPQPIDAPAPLAAEAVLPGDAPAVTAADVALDEDPAPAAATAVGREDEPAPQPLSQAWFVPRPWPSGRPRSHAAAWRRIAHDLPVHLAQDPENGVRVTFPSSNQYVVEHLGFGVGTTFGRGVGLGGAAAAQLQTLRGLTEGFAALA